MSYEDIVEKATAKMYGPKWNDPKDAPGEKMKEVWRKYVRGALDGLTAEDFTTLAEIRKSK